MHRFVASSLLLLCGCLDRNPNFVDPTESGASTSEVTGDTTTSPSPTSPSPTTTTDAPPTTTAATTDSSSSTSVGMTTNSSSTTGMPEPVCGDGVLDPGEECDDGDVSEYGACPQCKPAICGDGLVFNGLEECDDGNLFDDDDCNNACLQNYCGDKIQQPALGEECDDSNNVNSDMCVNCKLAYCGDQEVYQGVEDCDDGNDAINDGCEPDCHKSVKIVFVSSVAYTGDLGGLAGADDKCNKLAMAAMLPGPYMAWLSDGAMGPEQRFPVKANYPYVKVNQQMVALNWKQLTSGDLLSPIDTTELNKAPAAVSNPCPAAVHSNTTPSGQVLDAFNHCNNWTFASGSGRWGAWNATGMQWSDSCKELYCGKTARLYCVQQ